MFEDKGFSRTRLKSCFLKSLSSWASLVHDVEHSFVRDILCISLPLFGGLVCFLCLFLFLASSFPLYTSCILSGPFPSFCYVYP